MKEYSISESEEKFGLLLWENEPIKSGEVVALCNKKFNWKKSTTYTVLKKLCEKGLFKNENSLVTSLVTKDEFYANRSVKFVEDTFGGSLPKFLTAFVGGKKLSESQVESLRNLIDNFEED